MSKVVTFDFDNTIVMSYMDIESPNLEYKFQGYNKDVINKNKIIDTLELARSKYPGMSNSLDALCKRFNIDLSRRVKHNAVLDCELLREVYIYLLDAKEPKLSFTSQVEKKSNINQLFKYSKKVVQLSEEELKSHNIFLKSELKKNYF